MKNKYILRVIVNLYASFEKLIFFFRSNETYSQFDPDK